MTQRRFAAVQPPDDVLDHLAAAMTTVGLDRTSHASPVRWTAQENWHLTLAFYGTVQDAVVADLSEALGRAAAETAPMTVRLRGAGVFSRRTLWVGLGGQVDDVVRLIGRARAAGEGLVAFEDDRVRARPHLTVARLRDRGAPRRADRRARRGREGGRGEAADDVLAGVVHALALYEGPSWTVREVRLVRSEPGRGRGGGPLYTDVARHDLG